jgi:hypothetical protein
MLPLMLGVLVSGVIVFDLYSRSKKIREKLRLFQQQVAGSRYGGIFMEYWIKGCGAGLPFTITVTPGGSRSRPKVIVTCHKATPFKLMILRNESQSDFFHHIAHMPVLCSVVKTNDNHFDTRFSIYSHNSTDIAGYFYNTARKNAVQGIFDMGYTLVEFKGRVVAAQKYEYDAGKDLQPEILKAVLEKVMVLAQGF